VTIGREVIGGGEATAYPFDVTFPIHTDTFQYISPRFEAMDIVYAAINAYTYKDKDIRDKGARTRRAEIEEFMLPQIELLSRIGITLLQVQATEHLIKLCMTYVLQREPLSLEQLEAGEEKERYKNLGYFLQELRKRAAIAPEFDEVLRKFLKQRNMFAHNLNEVPGWDVNTDEGRKLGLESLRDFYATTSHVLKVFSGLVRLWEKQSDYPVPPAGDHPFFIEVDEVYTLLARMIFAPKE
jgi:hypothetical protein